MEERSLQVAAYCRVSTQQEEQDSSLELQESRYRRMIEENTNWTDVGIFSEKATGLNLRGRSVFQTMMRRCRKGKIDLILTKSTSRFGRNTLDMLRALQELQSLGVDVYFEKENLWLHERKMQIILTMYCAFAQAESEDMSRDIKWGIRQGFRSGTSGYAELNNSIRIQMLGKIGSYKMAIRSKCMKDSIDILCFPLWPTFANICLNR